VTIDVCADPCTTPAPLIPASTLGPQPTPDKKEPWCYLDPTTGAQTTGSMETTWDDASGFWKPTVTYFDSEGAPIESIAGYTVVECCCGGGGGGGGAVTSAGVEWAITRDDLATTNTAEEILAASATPRYVRLVNRSATLVMRFAVGAVATVTDETLQPGQALTFDQPFINLISALSNGDASPYTLYVGTQL
jgi:hypothetical protein